jgi:hypothetical protein
LVFIPSARRGGAGFARRVGAGWQPSLLFLVVSGRLEVSEVAAFELALWASDLVCAEI